MKYFEKKSILNWSAILTISSVLLFIFSCNIKTKDDDKCAETNADKITLKVIPDIFIVHPNGSAYVGGDVNFTIHKEYCNGDLSTSQYVSGTTDSDGRVKFFYTFNFDLNNKEDKIWFSYVVDNNTIDGYPKHNGYISYSNAESANEIGNTSIREYKIADIYYSGQHLVEE